MTAYYNENDPYAAEWLRNLIAAGHIAPGVVDERSIVDVSGAELTAFSQCHFFAGLGGWSLALRLAGWPDSRPVWTGSCPCQPFSAAGRGLGEKDPRHLWPEFRRLIAECNPAIVFGEQVASAAGREWLAGVRADLEGLAYAVGAADLCAASAGAPHIRQRLWWVADANQGQRGRVADGEGREHHGTPTGWQQGHSIAQPSGADSRLGDASKWGSQRGERCCGEGAGRFSNEAWQPSSFIDCADGKARRIKPGIEPLAHGVSNRVGRLRAYGNAIVPQVAAQFITAFREAQP